MIRAGSFAFFAGGVWALLPLVARETLGLGSGGYGLLLASVGVGAMVGATFSPAIRRSLSPRALLATCTLAIAGAALVLAISHLAVLDGAMLAVAGTGWILALGLLNSSFQSALPAWVKARGIAYYTISFQGATGIGSLALGAVAQLTSLNTGLLVLAGGLVVGAAATVTLRLPRPGDIDVTPAEAMPPVDASSEGSVGAVLVTVSYDVSPASEAAFLAKAQPLRHFRQRTGGIEWRLYRDEAAPGRYLETYLVGSWEEHERQHARATQQDATLLESIDAFLVPGTARVARHYLAAPPG
jgi:MFS family permease